MAILKQIKFPGMQEAAQIAVTQLRPIEGANNAITLEGSNTDVNDNGHPLYKIGLAIDGKTIVKDETEGLKSGLQLVYHEANKVGEENQPAHIALTDKDGKELSVIPVSNIVGNGVLKSSAYDAATGILTLTFAQADGTEKAVEVDLKAMLDINDMSIAENSKNYLEVTLGTASAEGETQAVFGAKTVKVAEATASKTGLVDAKDVKDYVDSKATNLAVKAQGDDYITAGVDAADNKQINVTANVQVLTATAGTKGVYDAEGGQTTAPVAGTLTGVAKSLVDGDDVATKVKTYVDGAVAIEVARADAKVLAAIKALDATVKDGLDSANDAQVAKGKHVGVKVVETDGVLTSISVVEDDIASKAALDAEIAALKAADTTLTENLAAEVSRAQAAEQEIANKVGLTGVEGSRTFVPTTNYGNGATSVMDNMQKLDTNLKTVADSLAAVRYKVSGTTLEFFGISGETVA